MARLMVRSKSHQKLRDAAAEPRAVNQPSSEQVSSETTSPRHDYSPLIGVAKTKYASPGSTPAFEVLSRPKTANSAMDEQRRRRLMAMGDPISISDGKETFNFPTPLREGPQPQLMSRYANSPLAARSNFERSGTPDTIGIALGSPSHLAQFESRWSPSPINDKMFPSTSGVTPGGTPGLSEVQDQKPDANQFSKPKISRWKSIFGRKNQGREPSRQQQENGPSPGGQLRSGLGVNSYHTWEHSSPRSPRMRSDTVPRYEASPQPKSPAKGIGRSQTAPTGRRNPGSPQVPPKDFLDVEIPSTKMERYSIMFNGILPNQPGGLLARRQSKRESKAHGQQAQNLQDLDIPPVPRRRNTTTSPTASPSYRLLIFPPETSSPKPLDRKPSLMHRPRPLKRSNTAPGALSPGLRNKMAPLSPMSEASESLETDSVATPMTNTSPLPAAFPGDDELKRIEEELDRVEQELRRDERERQALTPTPSEPSTPATPEDGKAVHAYIPFHSDATHDRKASTTSWEDRAIQEPDWEMITIGKIAEPGDRFSDAQTVRVVEEPSPIDKSIPSPPQVWHPLRMNSLVDKNRKGGIAAGRPKHNLTATMTSQPLPDKIEVQVARSMSVTKGARARPVMRTSPRGVEKGKGEHLVERKPLTPQVIEPTVARADSKGHKPMKSVAASIVDMA